MTEDSVVPLFSDDYSELDPNDTTYRVILGQNYIATNNAESTYEWDDSLEGQELANSMCRAEYDDNQLAEGQKEFCCQAIAVETDLIGIITIAKKLSGEEGAGFTVNELDTTYGAELFASARSLGASIAALASAAIVFSH